MTVENPLRVDRMEAVIAQLAVDPEADSSGWVKIHLTDSDNVDDFRSVRKRNSVHSHQEDKKYWKGMVRELYWGP